MKLLDRIKREIARFLDRFRSAPENCDAEGGAPDIYDGEQSPCVPSTEPEKGRQAPNEHP